MNHHIQNEEKDILKTAASLVYHWNNTGFVNFISLVMCPLKG